MLLQPIIHYDVFNSHVPDARGWARELVQRIKHLPADVYCSRSMLQYRVKPGRSGHTLITYVGPTLEKEMQASAAERSERSGTCEHVVRPHWHHYWVGKRGEQKRIRKWVHAFTRGTGTPARRIVKLRETIASDY